MSALASIKTSGWRASPLSSQWKPSGLLGQANQSSVEAGNVVSAGQVPSEMATVDAPDPNRAGIDKSIGAAPAPAVAGQTSPVVTKPVEASALPADGKNPLLGSPQRALMGNSAIVSEYESPVGKIIRSTHWDGGQYVDQTADGRVLREQKTDVGHWDSGSQQTVGYELEEPVAKPGKEYGLNTDKKVHRIEVFDAEGKSKGYTYRPADTRGLFSGFLQDFLATPIATPLLGWAGSALAPGIASATGMSAAASNVAASGLIGGVTGAASGAGFGKGAVMGAVGGAINNYNPAGQMGVSGGLQAPVNNAIKAGASAAIKGDSIKDAVVGTVMNPANLLKLPGWKSAETAA